MYSERMQILLSPEQRRRLEDESQRTGTSLASLVRDAVEARYRGVTQDDRRRALERIKARRVELPPPHELQEIVDSRFDGEVPDSQQPR